MITQTFVLGAGLGTRLRPLTDDLPKPLVPIFQKRLVTFALDHLIAAGAQAFHLNTHHLPGHFATLFPDEKYLGRKICFHHEPVLLETAGGIANIAPDLEDAPLLVYNGDVLSDLPLGALVDAHLQHRNSVTLALRSGGGPQQVALDGESRVVDIGNQLGTNRPSRFVFTGIYMISPEFVLRLQPGVRRSVIPYFLELIRQRDLAGVIIDDGNWWDVGTPPAYLRLHMELVRLSFPSFPVDNPDWRQPRHPEATIASDSVLEGCCVIGSGAVVSAGARLRNTIVWPGAQIASRSVLDNCIVRTRRTAEGTARDAII